MNFKFKTFQDCFCTLGPWRTVQFIVYLFPCYKRTKQTWTWNKSQVSLERVCMFVFTDKSSRPISLDAYHHTSLSTAEFYFQCLHVNKNHHEWRIWKWWVNTTCSLTNDLINVNLHVCTVMLNMKLRNHITPLCVWDKGVIADYGNCDKRSFASEITAFWEVCN